ncbi:multidrug resistance protein 3 [Gonapodya prolifera JEL478]|uniref:Multidrug resistance protein 3 n=1 Tax=Gonapodya prolifera (strain JEL478) TaxID=1344416 RepID=A0A138ZZK9_GONPJ|nr:multidrug resistance protein 3 [Gonapodya prolifera JEL478]|eukprot:KXS09939.1 multidrug resistance protein 3 [Gonapodya prolifera JEL478]
MPAETPAETPSEDTIKVPLVDSDIPLKAISGLDGEKEPLHAGPEADVKKPGFWDRFKPKPPQDEKPKEPTIKFQELFRFAKSADWALICIGLVSALVNGAMQPLMTIPMSDIVLALVTYSPNLDIPPGKIGSRQYFEDSVHRSLFLFVGIGVAAFVAGYLQYTCLLVSAERQLRAIRNAYFRAILRQDIGWFESGNLTGELTNRLQSDTGLVKDGMAEKLGVVAQCSAQFVSGFIIAYTKGWKMALVLTCVLPIVLVVGGIMGVNLSKRTKSQQDAYAAAGAVAEQSLSNIRTVAAFGGERRDAERYAEKVKVAYVWGVQIGVVAGIGLGTIFFVVFSLYGFAFWYGSTLIDSGEYNGGQVLNVFFSIMIGVMSVGQMAPEISALATATGAAYRIWTTIDRESPIDPSSDKGRSLESVPGRIEFKDVGFTYPSRQDVKVLAGFSMTVEPGKTVALVGASGSGKSTIVKLVERFYDPEEGNVLLDGVDLKDLNVRWLRRQIGIVSQEPILFDGSIRTNIILGIPNPTQYTDKELDDMVTKATKTANADFIWSLPHGIETNVGERGAMLSGGQKQRIAIARAIVSNPRILLLDEATSALDTASERQVQKALDQAAANRTTIIIAHRLSTVKNADQIIVLKHGKIVEAGSHNELLEKSGDYADLVKAQDLETGDSSEDDGGDSQEEMQTTEPVSITEKKPSSRPRRASRAEITRSRSRSLSQILSDEEIAKKKVDIGKSLTAQKAEDELLKKKEEEEYLARPTPWMRVIKLNKPEYGILLLASAGAAVMGVTFPLFSLIFSNMLTVFGKTGDELRSGARLYALLFLLLGFVQAIAFFFNVYFFTLSGERLTMRMRNMFFEAVVRQEVSFFDNPRRNTGVLTAKLADDATQVKGLFGQMLGVIVQLGATVIGGLIIAFVNDWRVTLVILSTLPLMVVGTYVQSKQFNKFHKTGQMEQLETNKIATETISNIRTVATLTKENFFADLYHADLEGPFLKEVKGAVVSGVGAGLAAGVQFLVLALGWWYSTKLVLNNEASAAGVQQALFAVFFMGASVGRVSSMMPSISKCQVAALSIFDVVDRTPELDAQGDKGNKPDPTGEGSFKKVEFKYPFRNNAMVLSGLNARADSGQSIAFVGPSGCGKSTAMALIERFYDVSEGALAIDNEDVRKWNLKALRQRMAMVGQEPVLFEGTIWENIAYGKPDGSPPATQEEVEAAARKANAYNYIKDLPEGFETRVGERGGLMSGGQKQRIAIARAIIRNPTILLLDEATSALDSESEHIVQAALDEAAAGRTTITIAHRLSTVQNCHRIYVFQAGKIVEEGTHTQLLGKRGLYWELCQQQGLGVNKPNETAPATISA